MLARLCSTVLLLPVLVHAQAAPSPVPGSYRLRICEGSCGAGPPTQGRLVLLAAPLRDASGAVLRSAYREPLNGCFLFTTLHPHGLLGGSRTGLIVWRDESRRGGGVLVNFDPNAVDSSYVAILHQAPGGLAGTGYSSYGSEPRPPPPPPDTAVAERDGDAAAAMCAADLRERERGAACAPLSPCR